MTLQVMLCVTKHKGGHGAAFCRYATQPLLAGPPVSNSAGHAVRDEPLLDIRLAEWEFGNEGQFLQRGLTRRPFP